MPDLRYINIRLDVLTTEEEEEEEGKYNKQKRQKRER